MQNSQNGVEVSGCAQVVNALYQRRVRARPLGGHFCLWNFPLLLFLRMKSQSPGSWVSIRGEITLIASVSPSAHGGLGFFPRIPLRNNYCEMRGIGLDRFGENEIENRVPMLIRLTFQVPTGDTFTRSRQTYETPKD